jgi:hypothetical protein
VTIRTLLFAVTAALLPSVTFAQPPTERTIDVGGNVRWLAGTTFGDVNAVEGAFGGARRTVFRSTTTLDAAPGVEGRVVFGLTPRLQGEAGVTFGGTHLTTRLSGDTEAADVTATEPVTQYLLEGGIAARLARWNRGRSHPFVSAGIGYLRQLHDGHTLVESGRTWYAGGGLRYQKNDKSHGLKSAGLRLEVRATILPGALSLDGATHVLPAVIAGVFFSP